MQLERFEFDIRDGVGRIVMNNPSRKNTVDLRFTQELAHIAAQCEGATDLRLVVLEARGDIFSFGGDINEFLEQRDRLRIHVREMTMNFHQAILLLVGMSAPLVVAVTGMAAGGGFSLACCADMTIAARSAKFNFAYTGSGLTPDGGSTYFLTRLVGAQKAFDLMATNPTLSAEEAADLGIVARVADDQGFEQALDDLVTQLLSLPSSSLAGLKRLLRASPTNTLVEQFEAEAKSISQIAASAATLETLDRFMQRSKKR